MLTAVHDKILSSLMNGILYMIMYVAVKLLWIFDPLYLQSARVILVVCGQMINWIGGLMRLLERCTGGV